VPHCTRSRINQQQQNQKSEVASGNLPLRVLADVPISGGTTRFDYQSLDSSSGRHNIQAKPTSFV